MLLNTAVVARAGKPRLALLCLNTAESQPVAFFFLFVGGLKSSICGDKNSFGRFLKIFFEILFIKYFHPHFYFLWSRRDGVLLDSQAYVVLGCSTLVYLAYMSLAV